MKYLLALIFINGCNIDNSDKEVKNIKAMMKLSLDCMDSANTYMRKSIFLHGNDSLTSIAYKWRYRSDSIEEEVKRQYIKFIKK